jgi:hypothetical protein
MAVARPSVEGPRFAELVREAESRVRELEAANWDFDVVPVVFAKTAAADVVGKELIHVHDGVTMKRLGRLVMGGLGSHFNLMGAVPSDSEFKVLSPQILKRLTKQLGTGTLEDMSQWSKLRDVQEVEFYNYGMFYTLRDMVFWLLLHEAGCFPSTLEHMVRHFAHGNVVQNSMYAAVRPSLNGQPVHMQAACLMVEFPSTVIEWMDKPLFGGFAPTTFHVEHLLTVSPTEVSHPYLPLASEGKVRLDHQSYYVRTFIGETPKDGTRGPDVAPEGPAQKMSS